METIQPVLTIDEIKGRVMRLHPGDIVEMPSDTEDGTFIEAEVSKIYKNFVEFKKKNGMKVILCYFDAMQVNIIKPSGFESYNKDMAMDDIENAVNSK